MRTVFIAFLFTHLVGYTLPQCNVCSNLSSIACVSETDFQVCFNGGPSGDTYSCPVGSVCTDTLEMCSSGSGINPACVPACGNCGADSRFACLNETHFSLCFGSGPSSTVVPCPQNTVCRNSLLNFCGDALQTVPDCDSGSTTPTTTVTTLCAGPGRFPIQSQDCKQYVYCYYYNKQLRAQIYTCQGNTIFYPANQQCVVPSSAFTCT